MTARTQAPATWMLSLLPFGGSLQGRRCVFKGSFKGPPFLGYIRIIRSIHPISSALVTPYSLFFIFLVPLYLSLPQKEGFQGGLLLLFLSTSSLGSFIPIISLDHRPSSLLYTHPSNNPSATSSFRPHCFPLFNSPLSFILSFSILSSSDLAPSSSPLSSTVRYSLAISGPVFAPCVNQPKFTSASVPRFSF